MEDQYVVTVYYHRSECSYSFGPLSWGEACDLYDKMVDDPNCDEPLIRFLNTPDVYRTGDEIG